MKNNKSMNLAVSNNETDLNSLLVKIPEEILINKEEELEWFCGFSEAEGMFYISKTGSLSFRIKLHKDDRGVLEYIKNFLSELANREVGVIVDSSNSHESYFIVSKYEDLYEIVIPILSKYFFTTSKYLDFQDFKKASEIKKYPFLEGRVLNKEELNQILSIKSNMNSKRLSF